MVPDRVRPLRALAPLLGLLGALVAAAPARASTGTSYLVELSTGVGENAYAGGPASLQYGLAAGLTFKLRSLPVRWYLLGNLVARNAAATGERDGALISADRSDFDLYASVRTVVPFYKMLRLYLEAGAGQRYISQSLARGGGLSLLSERDREWLVLVAVGAQVRLTRTFSVGLRGELAPLSRGPDLASFVADLSPTQNRVAAFAQLGVHF